MEAAGKIASFKKSLSIKPDRLEDQPGEAAPELTPTVAEVDQLFDKELQVLQDQQQKPADAAKS